MLNKNTTDFSFLFKLKLETSLFIEAEALLKNNKLMEIQLPSFWKCKTLV